MIIQGYKVTFSLGENSIKGESFDFNENQNILTSEPLGDDIIYSAPGKKQWTFTASGTLRREDLDKLHSIFSQGVVTCSVSFGDQNDDTFAGGWSGPFTIAGPNITASGSDKINWSLSATSAGQVTYSTGGELDEGSE